MVYFKDAKLIRKMMSCTIDGNENLNSAFFGLKKWDWVRGIWGIWGIWE